MAAAVLGGGPGLGTSGCRVLSCTGVPGLLVRLPIRVGMTFDLRTVSAETRVQTGIAVGICLFASVERGLAAGEAQVRAWAGQDEELWTLTYPLLHAWAMRAARVVDGRQPDRRWVAVMLAELSPRAGRVLTFLLEDIDDAAVGVLGHRWRDVEGSILLDEISLGRQSMAERPGRGPRRRCCAAGRAVSRPSGR